MSTPISLTSTLIIIKKKQHFTYQEIQQQLQSLNLNSSLSQSSSTNNTSSTTTGGGGGSSSSSSGGGGGVEGIEELSFIIQSIHNSNQQESYLKALKEFVSEKENEIEQVCDKNYQVNLLSFFPRTL